MLVHQYPKFNPLIKESGMSDFLDATSGAVTEFGDADLGDLRRPQRLVQLAHVLALLLEPDAWQALYCAIHRIPEPPTLGQAVN
jgi:hypothetical protein